MVIEEDFAYIAGFTTAAIAGQPFGGGGQDAMLIKYQLCNSTIVWVRTFGGNGLDVGGVS